MHIILERDEYKKLRLNPLKDGFIEQIRNIVAESTDWNGEALFNSVKEVLKAYDREKERYAEHPDFL